LGVSRRGLSLGELIAAPALNMRLVTGTSSALDVSVSWAHSTEMVDPRPHLRVGDLVCTVGTNLVDPQNSVRFVEAIRASGSAAVCLGLGEVHTLVPLALIQACDELSVALVEMAHGVPFLAINDVLVDARLRAQTGYSARDGELMAVLLEHLRSDGPARAMLEEAADALGGALVYSTPSETVRVGALTEDQVQGGSRIESRLGGESLTWLSAEPQPDTGIVAQIARLLQVASGEREVRERQRRQRVGQLFSLIADGLAHHAALLPEIEQCGLDGSQLTVSAWPASTAPLVAAQLPSALVADTASAVFALTAGARAVPIAADHLGLVCGYSSPVGLGEISRGIAEARATLLIARNRGRVAGPDSLADLGALLEQQPRSRLNPFVDLLIEPLIDPNLRGGADLLETLRSFLEHGGSLQATADGSFLHVNTVRNRLRRVCEIVGRNPLVPSEQVDFRIGLWAYDRPGPTRRAGVSPT
jgi:purine catabolism regulator